MATHYVDNVKFHAALKTHKDNVRSAADQGVDKPRVPEYIGECLFKIATHLSYKPNFINYSFREEMIGDGVENCLMYLDNFDPYRYSNPFAYFTQINWYAFVRRIQKEGKQTVIKGKIIRDLPFELFELQDQDDDGSYANSYLEFVQTHGIFDEAVSKDEARRASKKKAKQATLDDIFEDQ